MSGYNHPPPVGSFGSSRGGGGQHHHHQGGGGYNHPMRGGGGDSYPPRGGRGGGHQNGGRGGHRGGGGGYHQRAGGGRGGGTYHNPPAPPPAAGTVDENATPTMQVMDMGLDYKTYQHITDSNGGLVLSNVFSFDVDEVADAFEPTVGLFVLLMHLGLTTPSIRHRKSWLTTYQVLQRIFASEVEASAESQKYAQDAVDMIANSPVDDKLFENLFMLLDGQSEMRGLQAPSQRRVQRDPRGTFCNLHLSMDKKCNQEFACNQLHLIKGGNGELKHRQGFYVRLAEELAKLGHTEEDVKHRLRDCIFFARYGNRVTVRYGHPQQGGWIQFFKTAYTPGRLAAALRQTPPGMASDIQVQDRQPQFSKQMDLPNAQEAMDQIEAEVDKVLQLVMIKAEHLQNKQQQQSSSTSAPPMGDGDNSTPSTTSGMGLPSGSMDSVSSPTTRNWAQAVQSFKHAAERDHPNQPDGVKGSEVDSGLLNNLASNRPLGTPVTPDGATPLLAEINNRRFDSQ